MNKRNELDEFIKQLEEAVDNIVDEIDTSGNRPVNIDISINLFPLMVLKSEPCIQQVEKTPVDILETEKNIHAIIGLPGMEMENIKLACSGNALEVRANNANKTVIETIELPATVNKKSMTATCKDGILEVILNKRKARKRSIRQQSF